MLKYRYDGCHNAHSDATDRRERIPPLENGDNLTADEFRRRYEAMPEPVRAELIGRIVYMLARQ